MSTELIPQEEKSLSAVSKAIATPVDLLTQKVSQEITGSVNEKYQKRSEERADKRNRQMLLDQPMLTAEGRRRAGLNPYGDAILPGFSGQSQIDTSTGSNLGNTLEGIMANDRLRLDEAIAVKKLQNETKIANSQANLNDANAERARGLEGRDDEMHGYKIKEIVAKTNNEYLKGRILSCQAELAEYTLPNEMALSDDELVKSRNLINEQIANILLTNVTIEEKRASIVELQARASYLSAQKALADVGVHLTQAQTEQVWHNIANTDADTLLKYAQTDVEREVLKEVKARVDKINAEIKEIPANARVARNAQRFDNVWGGLNSLANLGSSAARLFGAIATGGMSEMGGSIITPSRASFSPSEVPRDIRTPSGLILPK